VEVTRAFRQKNRPPPYGIITEKNRERTRNREEGIKGLNYIIKTLRFRRRMLGLWRILFEIPLQPLSLQAPNV